MEFTLDDKGSATVTFNVATCKDVTVDDLKRLSDEIRIKATDVVITFNMSGVGPRLFASLLKMVQEMIEYTKHDGLLRRVEVLKAHFVFKFLFRIVPKEIRDMTVFIK